MKKILIAIFFGLAASCAQIPDYRSSPLDASVGRWSEDKSKCKEEWFEYEISKDKKKQIIIHPDGREEIADILSVQPGMYHLQYEPESRLSEFGKPVSWWLIFEDRNTYHMRRDDWQAPNRTKASWVRCN